VTTDLLSQRGSQPQPTMAPLGSVLSVQGSQAKVGLSGASLSRADQARATVGMFLGIRSGAALLIGMITEVTLETSAAAREQGARATARVDLMGEIRADEKGAAAFRRGVTAYPAIGDPAVLLAGRELQLVYAGHGKSIDIGHHQQDASISAAVNVDDMLSKHFAVLGTTGVGKSSGVVLILQQVLEKRPDLRIFLLDGHNEYGRCFGESALVLTPGNVKLPFWFFNFEETIDILYGGRTAPDEEIEILAEVIPLAKGGYTQYRGGSSSELRTLKKSDPKTTGFTADTPVPYRLADLIGLIDERMGKLENRTSRMKFHRLMQRIEAVSNDPRYGFMFENANVGGDTMADALSQLFRLPPNGKPMTIMQLAGFPTEVVNAVVSVLCRMAFEFGLWSDGAFPLLFVCEEAHRYASVDQTVGFGPTRRALSRIAKEGRKYGVFLGLVTQRPAELDPTIISQCSTLFALRMANDRDQALIRSAVADAGSSLLEFLPSLGTGEALAFGEGVPLPTRFKFRRLAQPFIPASEALNKSRLDGGRQDQPGFLDSIIERWRSATMSNKQGDFGGQNYDAPMRVEAASPQLVPAAEPSRLLKRTFDPRAHVSGTPQRDVPLPPGSWSPR
jgi:DNA helicase HerA-like ATPase